MLELYSENVSVNANSDIPLNEVSLLKGNCATTQGASSIVLNTRGVYRVSVNANVNLAAAGVASIQLKVNGKVVENAIAQATADASDIYNLSFETYVQVTSNNNPNCVCSVPTVISVTTGDDAETFNLIDVKVFKDV